MARSIDVSMFKKFQKLKTQYTPVMVFISEQEMGTVAKLDQDPLSYRGYVRRKFEEKGIEVLRFSHDYKNNQLGLVFLAGDSVVDPGIEVWALMGYNAKGKT